LREGRQWLEVTLERCPDAPPLLRRIALRGLGDLALQQGELETARACCEEIARMVEADGDARGIRLANHSLALVYFRLGRTEEARVLFEKNLPSGDVGENGLLTAATLNSLGEIARGEEKWAEAQRLYEDAVAVWRREGDRYGLSIALANLGAVRLELGDLDAATDCYREALEGSWELDDAVDVSLAVDGLAAVAVARGETERSARLAGIADRLRVQVGYEMEPADEAFRERYLARLRTRLDGAGLEAALDAGRAMTQERAIEYAREG